MPSGTVEVGRLEIRGAQVRFKNKATLEASDRNLATLVKVLVRVTPTPESRIFADFVFPGEIFRVFQESALVNYKEFLPKVEFSGIDNFRALVRYATQALPSDGGDLATLEFASRNAPAERFFTKDEMTAYETAIVAGSAPPARAPAQADATAPLPPDGEAARKAAAEQAWKRFAVELAAEKQKEPGKEPVIAGAALASLGAALILGSLIALTKTRHLPENAPNVFPFIALGAILGMAFVILGLIYLRRTGRR